MKRFFALLLVGLMVLGGCSDRGMLTGGGNDGGNSGDYNYEDDAAKLSGDTTYYNDFLGVSITVPKGWWLYWLSGDNMSETQGTTGDPMALDVYKSDDYRYIDLIEYANLQYSTQSNHIGISLSAETMDGLTSIDDFMEYMEWSMVGDDSENLLLESGQETLAGVACRTLTIEVPNNNDPFYVFTLSCKVEGDYYLSIFITYWPENTEALDYALDLLEDTLTLTATL